MIKSSSLKPLALSAIFACACTFSFAQPKIKSVTINFVTPKKTEPKDWDTKIRVYLYQSSGALVATADKNDCDENTPVLDVPKSFCCAAPVKNQQLTDPRTAFLANGLERGPFSFEVQNHVQKQNIETGYITVEITPKGNDRWLFKPRLTLYFDDGSTKEYSNFKTGLVDQDAPMATFTFH